MTVHPWMGRTHLVNTGVALLCFAENLSFAGEDQGCADRGARCVLVLQGTPYLPEMLGQHSSVQLELGLSSSVKNVGYLGVCGTPVFTS